MYLSLVALYTSMGMTQKAAVKACWDEYRIAAQFMPLWDRAVENIELIRRKEMGGQLPTQDDITGLVPSVSRGGSPSYWMQQIDWGGWFVRDELGIGTSINIFDTQATLERTNAKRARQYKDTLARLAKARQVLKRTVRA